MLKRWLVFNCLVLIVVAATWALWVPGFFRIHDYTHAARIGEVARSLQEGHFPVRWSANFGYGYGMPLFEFYAPLPYYVGAALFLVGLPILWVLKLLFFICTVGTTWGGYKLGRTLFGRVGGVILAASLTLAPYRALNLFIRGALSEGWGLMALPWILLGIVQVVRQEKRGWVTLVLGLVVLLLSHNLTTLMFVPMSALAALVWWVKETKGSLLDRRSSRWIVAWQLAGSYVLAIALGAFYLIPAFLEKGYTKVDTIIGGYFDYHLHFLYVRQFLKPFWGYGGSGWGPDDPISFFLGWGVGLGLGLVGLGALRWSWQQRRRHLLKQWWQRHWLLLLSSGLVVVSLLMTLGRSLPVWESVKLLSYIQFPWRWLAVAVVWLSVVLAYGTRFFTKWQHRWAYGLVLTSVLLVGNVTYFKPEGWFEDPVAFYYTDGPSIRSSMSNTLQDYIPNTMPDKIEPVWWVARSSQGELPQEQVLVNRGHEKLVKTAFTQPTVLEWSIAGFPGWRAELDGQPQEFTVSPHSQGIIAIEVPAGEHLVGVYWGATPVRQAADVVSAGAVVVLLYLLTPVSKPRLKPDHA